MNQQQQHAIEYLREEILCRATNAAAPVNRRPKGPISRQPQSIAVLLGNFNWLDLNYRLAEIANIAWPRVQWLRQSLYYHFHVIGPRKVSPR
jgi:hypothetical protein